MDENVAKYTKICQTTVPVLSATVSSLLFGGIDFELLDSLPCFVRGSLGGAGAGCGGDFDSDLRLPSLLLLAGSGTLCTSKDVSATERNSCLEIIPSLLASLLRKSLLKALRSNVS